MGQLFQVLVADDEPAVREAVISSISWEEYGMETPVVASNGKEALEIIKTGHIDVAILDVRMPGMNGIEACAEIRKMNSDIQIIIISGYAEFSYAERAMEYGVLGYCLKPVESEKLEKLLIRAQNKLSRCSGIPAGSDLFDAIEEGDMARIRTVRSELGIHRDPCWFVFSIGGDMFEDGPGRICIRPGRNQNLCIMEEMPEEEKFLSMLKDGGAQGIGISAQSAEPLSYGKEIRQCTEKACQFFIRGIPCICRELPDHKAQDRILEKIREEIRKDNWDTVRIILSRIRQEEDECFTISGAQRLNNVIYSSGIFGEEEADFYAYSFQSLINRYGNFIQMLQCLDEAIRDAEKIPEKNGEFTNTAFMKLLSYVTENYKKDISLTSAGEALHMNPNYISQLFKKEAGINFVRYVTQLRLDEAVRLLTTTNMPVIDIAAEVGFNDYFYFLKTFKKNMYKTPTQYREG